MVAFFNETFSDLMMCTKEQFPAMVLKCGKAWQKQEDERKIRDAETDRKHWDGKVNLNIWRSQVLKLMCETS